MLAEASAHCIATIHSCHRSSQREKRGPQVPGRQDGALGVRQQGRYTQGERGERVFICRIWRHTHYQLVPSDHRGAVGQLHSAAPPDIPTAKVFLLKWKQGSSYQPLCNSEELSCLLGAPESSSWIHLLSVVPVTQLSETANNLWKSI